MKKDINQMKQRIPLFENYNSEDVKVAGVTNIKSQTDMSHFGVLYRGSVMNEKPGTYGVSHLTEHLVCKAIDHLQDTFDEDGIDWNAFTTDTYIYFYISGLDEYVNKHKAEFLKLLGNFKVTEEEFLNEKKIVLEEYGDAFNGQLESHYLNLLRKLYNNFNPIGLRKDLDDITYEDMKSFVANQYAKPHQIINISKNNPFTTPVDVATNKPIKEYVRGNYDVTLEERNTYKGKASIINISDIITEDIAYIKFICEMMGAGLNSPLYKEIREKKGLVYGLSCNFHELTDTTGFIYVCAESSVANVDEFQKTLETVLKDTDTYFTKERFEVIKKKYSIRFKKNSIELYKRYEKFIDDPSTLVENIINTVTFEKLQEIYAKYFNFDKFYKSIDSSEF
jgi:predicted Zn-dependent peptidase